MGAHRNSGGIKRKPEWWQWRTQGTGVHFPPSAVNVFIHTLPSAQGTAQTGISGAVADALTVALFWAPHATRINDKRKRRQIMGVLVLGSQAVVAALLNGQTSA